ncbi:uncharacterized protein LOC141525257 [Cotesia typhae]|uniref:uncharacterized protein LOC141525257 n=1 Tax=Cotesia typhae TaxID=2053667 RepID=UPI003D69F973
MKTLYSTFLVGFLLAAVTSATSVSYTDLAIATFKKCKDLNDSSNVELQNQYYRSLTREEKYIVTNYGLDEYLACFMKELHLFTLQDFKAYKDALQHCYDLIVLNSEIMDPDQEQLHGNICTLKALKTIEPDNSIDAEALKKYLAIFVVVTDEAIQTDDALLYFDNCVKEQGRSADDTIAKFLQCIGRFRDSKT